MSIRVSNRCTHAAVSRAFARSSWVRSFGTRMAPGCGTDCRRGLVIAAVAGHEQLAVVLGANFARPLALFPSRVYNRGVNWNAEKGDTSNG